ILPSFQSTHLVVDSMKPFCHDPRNSWRQIPCNIRDQMWNQFKTKCTWHPPYQNAINSIFVKKVAQRIKDTMFAARNASKMPDWLRKDVWDKHLEKWNTTEWKADSEQLKANRASSKGGSLHTGGSISFVAHKLRLEKERGRDMSHAEVFKEMHKKKDGTREHWVETQWQQTHPPSTQPTPNDMTSLWTEVAGGVNKGRVYRFGVRRPTGHPNSLLANSSSSQNQEQMEDMRKEIRDLKQQLDSQF
uniref:Transposase, Ptta/En/Spm, plant n=1 Tax=Nicotiana tabacum TaxID=4097 RepID=A0A1S3XV24_TOBAC